MSTSLTGYMALYIGKGYVFIRTTGEDTKLQAITKIIHQTRTDIALTKARLGHAGFSYKSKNRDMSCLENLLLRLEAAIKLQNELKTTETR